MVEARSSESSGNDYNIVLLAPTKLGPHQIHNFDVADAKANMATISHVKVTIQPDGGLSRIRLFGHAKHAWSYTLINQSRAASEMTKTLSFWHPHQIHNFNVIDAKANAAIVSHVQPDGDLSRIGLFGHAKRAWSFTY